MSIKGAANNPQSLVPEPSSLTDSQRKQLSAVKRKEVELRKWLGGRKDFSKEEKDALECQSYGESAEFWRKTSEDSKDDLDRRRQSGWRKWSHGYQSFGAAVMRFMEEWDPIISLVRGFGGAYGDMAIGTISAVFVIAQSKDMEEGYIASALVNIKDRSLGFATYQEIYTEDNVLEEDLRSKIIDAYTSFINLAIEAIRYYKSRGAGRTLCIIGQPTKFKVMADEVQNSIVAVQLRCGELLSKDVRTIKGLNKELEKQVQELQISNYHKNLADINQEWNHGRPPQEQHMDLNPYRRILGEEVGECFEQFRVGDEKRQIFEAGSEYKKWLNPRHSSVLVLIGHSEPSIMVAQFYCWLSPVVLDFIEQQRTNQKIHAYYLLEVKRETSLHDVMISILFQLLRFKPQVLDEQDHYFKLRSLHKQFHKDSHEDSQHLEELALVVIKFFKPSETVHIMLDRLDRCSEPDRLTLLNLLGCMAKEAPCILKVLVVISGSDWTFDLKEIEKKYRDAVIRYVAHQEKTEESNYY